MLSNTCQSFAALNGMSLNKNDLPGQGAVPSPRSAGLLWPSLVVGTGGRASFSWSFRASASAQTTTAISACVRGDGVGMSSPSPVVFMTVQLYSAIQSL